MTWCLKQRGAIEVTNVEYLWNHEWANPNIRQMGIEDGEEALREAGYFPTVFDVEISQVSNVYSSGGEEFSKAYAHKAFATSDCFPNVDISEVISALENGFGVRLLFDSNYQRVRIVLLRNIFRNEDVQEVSCNVIETTKIENNIRGFRMTYGDSEDTAFYYKGFADKLPHKKPYFVDNSDTHDYSHWQLNADYKSLIQKVSAFDLNCYVTPNNGNAYGIKVDKDAKHLNEQYPSLFGFADFMDAEDGDCTGEEGTIKEINMGFTPAIVNDVNFEKEKNNSGITQQQFAVFVDADMRSRRADLEDLSAPIHTTILTKNTMCQSYMMRTGVYQPAKASVSWERSPSLATWRSPKR